MGSPDPKDRVYKTRIYQKEAQVLETSVTLSCKVFIKDYSRYYSFKYSTGISS